MNRFSALVASISTFTALALSGCSATPTVVGTPGPAQDAALAKLKTLEGEWTVPAEGGMPGGTIVYSVTSGGSAIREIMFPGTGHEMTNVYHLDGKSLICTHYCAMGNQARMRAPALTADGKSINFTFDSVTNLAKADDHYMGGLRLDMPDNDHLVQTWTSFEKGKPVEDHAVFKLTRKR